MDKAIVEIKLSGTIDDEAINGKVHAYPPNIKHVKPYGLKLAIMEEFNKAKTKAKDVVRNFALKNKPTAKKVGALFLAGTILMGSLTACKIVPKAEEVTNTPKIEQAQEETKHTIEYKVVDGDSLWIIAAKYNDTDNKVANEIDRICADNGLDFKAVLPIGRTIKLNVPESSLEKFGYTVVHEEINEWDAMADFISSCFDFPEDSISPDALPQFTADKEYFYGLRNKAFAERDNLRVMQEEEILFHDDAAIENKKNEITFIYLDAIEELGKNLFAMNYEYGVDFLPERNAVVVELDKSLKP